METSSVCVSQPLSTVTSYLPGSLNIIFGLLDVKPCPGNTYTYSVTNNIAVTNYIWTPPANTTITSGQGTNSITLAVASNFVSGSLCVTGSNYCGTSTARCVTLSKSSIGTPGTILGQLNGNCQSTTRNLL